VLKKQDFCGYQRHSHFGNSPTAKLGISVNIGWESKEWGQGVLESGATARTEVGNDGFSESDDGVARSSIALIYLGYRKAKVAKKSGAICGPGNSQQLSHYWTVAIERSKLCRQERMRFAGWSPQFR
jgi:hypothetical protein